MHVWQEAEGQGDGGGVELLSSLSFEIPIVPPSARYKSRNPQLGLGCLCPKVWGGAGHREG